MYATAMLLLIRLGLNSDCEAVCRSRKHVMSPALCVQAVVVLTIFNVHHFSLALAGRRISALTWCIDTGHSEGAAG